MPTSFKNKIERASTTALMRKVAEKYKYKTHTNTAYTHLYSVFPKKQTRFESLLSE